MALFAWVYFAERALYHAGVKVSTAIARRS
jgi:hypothetical protein